jgi:predicted acyl esterase
VNLTGPKAGPGVKPLQRLLIGPWGHATNRGTRMGDVDFGPSAVIDLDGLQTRWFNRWLNGQQNGIDNDAPVRIFVMGENVWRMSGNGPSRGRST